ncbi:hypothetical protein DSECCO2_278310 [anaerobic digester metagenome]
MGGGIYFLLPVTCDKHLYSGKNQQSAEKIKHPCKLLYDGRGGEYKGKPEHNGGQDSPEQNPAVIAWFDAKSKEYHDHDENIVDRQGFLDQITGEKFKGKVILVNPECFRVSQSFGFHRMAILRYQMLQVLNCSFIPQVYPLPVGNKQYIKTK